MSFGCSRLGHILYNFDGVDRILENVLCFSQQWRGKNKWFDALSERCSERG